MKSNSENNSAKQRRLANLATPKQRLFVREYCHHLNATRAAIAAGYSEKGARQAGARLLTNVNVSAEIGKLTQKACERLEISAENVLRELARLAFLDPRNFYDANGALRNVTDLDDDTAACIAGMEVEDVYHGRGEERVKIGYCRKIKFADKGAHLERLGRYLKLFTDKVEHSGVVEHVDLSHLTDEQLAAIEKIFETADSNAGRHQD
jgi:phage terminase small subunit